MQTITIEIADDGRVSVTSETEGAEPQSQEFETLSEAIEALEGLVEPAEAEEPEMDDEDMDPATMWDQEAAARPKNPSMMG